MKTRLKGLFVGLAFGFLTTLVIGTMVGRNLALDGTYTYLKLFNDVLSLIRSSYVDEVDTGGLMEGAYTGMLSELDPFSEYLSAEEYADYKAGTARSAKDRPQPDVGLRVARKEGIVYVVSVRPGSEAETVGITPGDIVRRIADRSPREMTLFQVESALAGPAGTRVALSLIRRDEPRKLDAELTRREPTPAPVTLEVADAKDGLGVLRVPQFGPGAASQIGHALQSAEKQKLRRLLIDLRGNAWGGVEEAARAAALFVGDVVVARLKDRGGVVEEVRGGAARSSWSGTVGLLVNGATAEAAELFAAAVHDGRDAPLIGEPTCGVGAQQDLIPLKNGGWLKLSVRKFTSPAGTAWHGSGLKPGTPVVVAQENMKPAERLRQQLKLALEQFRALGPATAARAFLPEGSAMSGTGAS